MLNNLNSDNGTRANYESDSVKKELNALEQRVTNVETAVNDMSTNITTVNVSSDSIHNTGTVDTLGLTADNAVIQAANIGDLNTNCTSVVDAFIDCIHGTTNADKIVVDDLQVNNKITSDLKAAKIITDCLSVSCLGASCFRGANSCMSCVVQAGQCVVAPKIETTNIMADQCVTAKRICGTTSVIAPDVRACNGLRAGNAQIDTTLTANTCVVTPKVVTSEGQISELVTKDIDTENITAKGKINLDPEMQVESDYYLLTVPKYRNWQLFITSGYNGSYWDVTIIGTENTAVASFTNNDGTLLDFSYDDNGALKIAFKGEQYLKYAFIHSDENTNPLTVELNGTRGDNIFAPETSKGYWFRSEAASTVTDRDSSITYNGRFRVSEFDIDAIELQDLFLKTLHLKDALGEWTVGNDGDYITVKEDPDTGDKVLQFRTPTDNILGVLNDTDNFITERTVAHWNGTSCLDDGQGGTETVYPVTNLGNASCVHGTVDAEGKITGNDGLDITCGNIVNSDANGCVIAPTGCFTDAHATNLTATTAHITGDLYVDGSTHIVDEETVSVEGDIITTRVNNNQSLGNNQVSGVMVNKYDGTHDLTVATDNTGTLRVGTASGTATSYTDIAFNDTDKKWYSYVGDVYTEITPAPAGEMTAYTGKEEVPPYTRYATATFTEIDVTTLEPVLTRAEENVMNSNHLIRWNSTDTKAETVADWEVDDNGALTNSCIAMVGDSLSAPDISTNNICVHCDVNADTVCTGTLNVSGCGTVTECFTVGCNHIICGDLFVCGNATIACGIVPDKVNTMESACNQEEYLTFVERNNATQCAERLYTNADVKVNPSTGTLTANKFHGPLEGNADCASAICVAQKSDNVNYHIPFISGNTGAADKAAYVSNGCNLTYNPSTGRLVTNCVCLANDLLAANLYAPTHYSNYPQAANQSCNVAIYARCCNASALTTKTWTFRACDGYLTGNGFQATAAVVTPTVFSNYPSCNTTQNVTICARCCNTSAISSQKWIFCGSDGCMHGNVCGSLTGNATCASYVQREACSNNYLFEVALTNCNTSITNSRLYVSSSCRLSYCNTTGNLRITNSAGNTVVGSVTAACGYFRCLPNTCCICTGEPADGAGTHDTLRIKVGYRNANNCACYTCWNFDPINGFCADYVQHQLVACDSTNTWQLTGYNCTTATAGERLRQIPKLTYNQAYGNLQIGRSNNYCQAGFAITANSNVNIGAADGYRIIIGDSNTIRCCDDASYNKSGVVIGCGNTVGGGYGGQPVVIGYSNTACASYSAGNITIGICNCSAGQGNQTIQIGCCHVNCGCGFTVQIGGPVTSGTINAGIGINCSTNRMYLNQFTGVCESRIGNIYQVSWTTSTLNCNLWKAIASHGDCPSTSTTACLRRNFTRLFAGSCPENITNMVLCSGAVGSLYNGASGGSDPSTDACQVDSLCTSNSCCVAIRYKYGNNICARVLCCSCTTSMSEAGTMLIPVAL